jgi:hypothetical protein
MTEDEKLIFNILVKYYYTSNNLLENKEDENYIKRCNAIIYDEYAQLWYVTEKRSQKMRESFLIREMIMLIENIKDIVSKNKINMKDYFKSAKKIEEFIAKNS